MNTFLQAQLQNFKSRSIKKFVNPKMKALAGIFFLAALLGSKASFAAAGFGSASLTPASQTVCSGQSGVMTLTGIAGACTLPSGWTASYQFDSAPAATGPWYQIPVAGGGYTEPGSAGTISAASSAAVFTTLPFAYSPVSYTVYYRVRLTGITNNCNAGSIFTTGVVAVTVNPGPSAISGNNHICVGVPTTLSDAIGGGVWTSSNTAVATIDPVTGIVDGHGASTGTATISYSIGTCVAVYPVTVNPIPGTITSGSGYQTCVGSVSAFNTTSPVGTWSSSNPAIGSVDVVTGQVYGISAGTVIITYYKGGTGCIATHPATINPIPDPIAGPDNVCYQSTITLTDPTPGGTWSSGNVIIALVGSSTGIVTGNGVGTTTISYTIGTGPTACRVGIPITVNPVPAAISGSAFAVCVNNTITLSTTSTGGTWTSSDPLIATIGPANGVVSGISGGTVVISYSFATGCAKTKIVTVNPLPAAISGIASVCVNSTITLTDPSTGGLWTISDPSVATINSATGVLTGNAQGTTLVTYTTTATGCFTVSPTAVTVNPLPAAILNNSPICVNNTITLTDATTGGTWSSVNPTVATIGSATGVMLGMGAGTSTITYTLSTGCFRTAVGSVNALPAAITGTLSMCVGTSTTLASASTGGTWSSSNTSVATVTPGTSIINGITAGTATISYTISTGCLITADVTVNPLPAGINGSTTICAGTTLTLTDATAGGTWQSSNTAIATVGSSTGIVTGLAGGTATISYILSTGCYTTTIVTINSLAPSIGGTLSLCTASNTTLSNSSAGGTWSSSNTTVAIVGSSSGIVTGLYAGTTSGTATITYTALVGCPAYAVVTVYALPASITGTQVICVGNTTTFSDASPGGTWSSSNGSIASVDASGVITGISGGTAIIYYTYTATGCRNSRGVTVNPLPLPIGGPSTVCAGSTVTLTDVNTGGTWVSSNTAVGTIGLATGAFTGIATGTTTITYTLATGCQITTVLSVNPSPAPIGGTAVVCVGGTTLLTNSVSGGVWTSSNTARATVSATGLVSGVAAGTATISYALGACVTSVVVTVNPLPAAIVGASVTCQGNTVTFTDATTGGTWSSSNTAIGTIDPATGVFTALAAGNTNIIYTLNTGCSVTRAFTVNPLPTPIAGPGNVCVGGTITLSNATSGGTWTSSNTPVATIDPATGVVSGISNGTTTISYTLPTGCSITAVVSVDPLPDTIAGGPNVCIGAPTTLTDATSGGSWTSSNTAVATVGLSTGVVTGLALGTSIITYTLPTGCYITTVITINMLSTMITGNQSICLGDVTTLSNATPGGVWTSQNPSIATVSPTGAGDGFVSSVTAGTVAITYTLPTGCYTTAIVTVNPIPPAFTGTMVVCEGLCTSLFDVTTGGTWSSSNTTVASAGSASGVICGVSAGLAIITYTLPTNCYITAEVTVNPVPSPITGTFAICMGFTTTLTDPTPSGTWSSSNGGVATIDPATGVVTSVSPGTTIITYTLSTGCLVTALFTVNPLPSPIVGNFIVCEGSSTLLTDADPGGTWISSNTPVATIGLNTGLLTGVLAGTSTITYTLPTGCIITQDVTVNPLPAPITGANNVCAGYNITLTDATAGGTWTSTNPGVGTIDPVTGEFTGISAGVTVVSYTIATGCASTIIITVNPIPNAITGLSQVCFGLRDTLTTSSHGGTWSSSNTGVATVTPFGTDSVSVFGATAGTVTITYTLPTGCFTIFNMTVNPLPLPITGPDSICVGSTGLFEDATAGGNWTNYHSAQGNIDFSSGLYTAVHFGVDTVVYTLSTGCLVRKSVRIDSLPNPIYGTDSVCVGFTTTLHDSSALATWSSSNVLIATIGSLTGIVTGVSDGVDTIYYTFNTTGCRVSHTYTVYPIPVISVSTSFSMICRNATDTLHATGAGPGGAYTWTPPATLSCAVCPDPIATPTLTTVYTVTGTTIHGCSSTARDTIVVDTLLNHIKVTGRANICAGDCDTLIASGFTWSPFAWHPAAGLSCTICDTTIACPDATRTYIAVAVDTFGCRDSVAFTVTVNPLPIVHVLPSPATICRNDTTTLHATANIPGTKFAWFPNAFLSCDTCANPVASDTMNLIYRVTGITPFGCADSIFVPVSVLDNTVNTISHDTVICKGQVVHLFSSATAGDGSRSDFVWYPQDGSLDEYNIPNPTATPAATTIYTLVITPNRCFHDTMNVTVAVVNYPAISISVSPTANVIAGTIVTLNASVSNEVTLSSYAWSPPSFLSCTECFQTIATPTTTTTYTFTAVSNYGCSGSATVTIGLRCDNTQVFIPNTFTPNGDGVNDRFYISGKGLSTINSFRIYNRWGQLLYEAHNFSPNDPAYGWDGTFQGVVLPPDVFVYTVEAQCELGGDPYTYKGDISIVR